MVAYVRVRPWIVCAICVVVFAIGALTTSVNLTKLGGLLAAANVILPVLLLVNSAGPGDLPGPHGTGFLAIAVVLLQVGFTSFVFLSFAICFAFLRDQLRR